MAVVLILIKNFSRVFLINSDWLSSFKKEEIKSLSLGNGFIIKRGLDPLP